MMETGNYYRESDYYRAWIEASGDGGIRILRRMKFKALVWLFKDIITELRKGSSHKARITFYIPRSLNEEMSGNAREFIGFCKACMDLDIELVIME